METDLPEVGTPGDLAEVPGPYEHRHGSSQRRRRRRRRQRQRQRRRRQNILLAALAVVVLLGVVLKIVSTLSRTGPQPVVLATLAGRDITNRDLNHWLERYFHGPFDNNPQVTPQFAARAFDEMVTDAAVLADAEKLGLERAPSDTTDAAQSEDADDAPPGFGPGERPLLAELRDLVTDAVRVSPGEVREEFMRLNERARIAYVVVDASRYAQDVPESPGSLEGYFADHFMRYRMPEQRTLRFVVINSGNAGMLATAWRNESNSGAHPSLDNVWAGEGKAWLSDWVDKELKADPAHFDLVAARLGLEASETTLFQFGQAVPELNYNQELARRAFQLVPDEVTEPIAAGESAIIALLGRVVPAHGRGFSEVRGQVDHDYRTDRARVLVEQRAHELALKAQTAGLRTVAASLGLQVEESQEFTLQSKVNDRIPGSALEAAFSLPPGQTSGVVPVGNDRLVFQVLSQRPADESGFAAQRDQIARGLLLRKEELAWQIYRRQLRQRLSSAGELVVNSDAVRQAVSSYAGS